MKEAGLRHVVVGLSNDQILKNIKKGVTKAQAIGLPATVRSWGFPYMAPLL
jgi:hypothetical protein